MQYNKIYIEITNSCNLSCSFCPTVSRKAQFMDAALFTNICAQIEGITKEITFHLMGEPLLHPSFLEFLDIAHAHNLKVNIVTNGTATKNHTHLAHKTIRQINFSLHSFDANTQKIELAEYLSGIFELSLSLLQKRDDLYINYRLWDNDLSHLKPLNTQIIDSIEEFFGVALNRNVDFGFKKSKKIIEKLYLHLDTLFEFPSLRREKISDRGFCYGLSSHFGILVDGSVVPCCLDSDGVITLGNINDKKIVEILASKRALKIKSGFLERMLVEEMCQRCSFINRFG